MVNILVLDATGYLGLTICQAIRRAGHKVYGSLSHRDDDTGLLQNEIIPVPSTRNNDKVDLGAIEKYGIDIVVYTTSEIPRREDLRIVEEIRRIGAARQARPKPKDSKSTKNKSLGLVYLSRTWQFGVQKNAIHPSRRGLRGAENIDIRIRGAANARLRNNGGMMAGLEFSLRSLASEGWAPQLEQAVSEAQDALFVAIIRPGVVYGYESSDWEEWFDALLETGGSVEKLHCHSKKNIPLVHVDDVASATLTAALDIAEFDDDSGNPMALDLRTTEEPLQHILERAAALLGFRGQFEYEWAHAGEPIREFYAMPLRMALEFEPTRVAGMREDIDLVVNAWRACERDVDGDEGQEGDEEPDDDDDDDEDDEDEQPPPKRTRRSASPRRGARSA